MSEINQNAIITKINNHNVHIKFLSCSACAGCTIKGHCGLSETKEKEIIIFTSDAAQFSVGEEVIVSISSSQGTKAVIFAYVIPLILMLAVIISLIIANYSETTSGICGTIILIPYYFCIFLMRKRIGKSFQFKISKRTK